MSEGKRTQRWGQVAPHDDMSQRGNVFQLADDAPIRVPVTCQYRDHQAGGFTARRMYGDG